MWTGFFLNVSFHCAAVTFLQREVNFSNINYKNKNIVTTYLVLFFVQGLLYVRTTEPLTVQEEKKKKESRESFRIQRK